MSGKVREAFRKKGHDAYSIDLVPSLDSSPYHLLGDCRSVLDQGWDLLIAHPPCTYLCNSGVHWLHNKYDYTKNEPDTLEARQEEGRVRQRWYDLFDAQDLFEDLWTAPIPRIAIENPIPHKYAGLPKYNQTIQPYMFGDDASKRTCLWLHGLNPLVIPPSEKWVQPRIVDGKKRWANQTDSGQNKETPAEDRGMKRSITYDGIAQALADNWG